MTWFRNLLISVGAYLLSYWLVVLITWPLSKITNRITYGDSLFDTIAMGVMTSMGRAICAGIGAVIVMFFVNSAKPQRWAWWVALLYAAFGPHMHWQRTPTFRDWLWQGVDRLWPAVVCVAVAAIIARRRRNDAMGSNGGEHRRWWHLLWAPVPRGAATEGAVAKPGAVKAYVLIALAILWALVIVLKMRSGGISVGISIPLPHALASATTRLLSAIVLLGWLVPLLIGSRILWKIGLSPRPFVLVRNLWVLSSVATLVVSLVRYSNDNFSTVLIMWALSFPSGFLVVVIHNYMGAGFTGRSECVFVWLMFFVAGYAQWFILIPALRGRFKKPTNTSAGGASDDATEKTT